MCKTCLRNVTHQGDENWGPWGISSAYTSAALSFHRLWHTEEPQDSIENQKVSTKEKCPESAKKYHPVFDNQKAKRSSSNQNLAYFNVGGGSPLQHTYVPSHAHSDVGTDEGDSVFCEINNSPKETATSAASVTPVVSNTSTVLNIFKGSGLYSKKENVKITKDSGTSPNPGKQESDGREIINSQKLVAAGVGVVEREFAGALKDRLTDEKLESSDQVSLSSSTSTLNRPFFYLHSDDEDSVVDDIDRELLNNPDLYPVPKCGGDTATVTSQSSPLSHSKTVSPPTPQSPLKTTNNSSNYAEPTFDDIKNRIRSCLKRARTRSTSSISGVGSFEAGLYRLEGLLEDRDDDDEFDPKSEPVLTKRSGAFSSRGRLEHVKFPMKKFKNAATITDVCTADNVAEVELISIVQEQIPTYKLRADTITEFSGYDNADWGVTFPALKEEEAEALSPEQAEGALAYFVLCGNRVSQMTKTYNDIEAVTRLLQEKEKDLELAAKIGQQLLARNKTLEERNGLLDADLSAAGDKITQLTHNLQMKSDLLQIYTNDVDDASSCESTPTGMRGSLNVDFLQHRVQNLEDENKYLRNEASQLAYDTQECEDKEKELVTDVIKQLTDANLQVRQLNDDLAKKVEDSLRQQEEITHLLAQVVDLQSRNKRTMAENDELHNMVGVARECQQELTMELAELKEKYAEVLDLLHDTQDQLRRVQKKNLPGSRGHHLGSNLYGSPFNSGGSDSIANELQSLNSIGEEMTKGTSNSMRRTFDTVRMSGTRYSMAGSQGSLSSLGYGGSVHSTPTHHPHTPSHMAYLGGSRGSSLYSGGSGHPSLDSGADSDASLHTDSEDNYPGSHLGVPGWPGTPDLDSCLRRLGPGGDRSGTPSHFLPYGCRTPDSIMSTGSGKFGVSDWKLPQKLQIVKPIEGSLTLSQWSRLATPNLAGLLEEREGVAIKGGAGIEQLKLDVYSMSDLEEDEPEEENPGKRFMSTSGVFTYTNSTILHPDEQTTSTRSLQQAQVSVLAAAPTAHATPTPGTPIRGPSCPPSRRGSTATFSTNTGLAKVLNERGMIQQSVFSPTATPANSPTHTRPGSPEAEGYKLPGLDDLTKTFHYGASLLRRTFYKNDPSAPQSPSGPRVNLVEQVQAIGVDRFMGSGQVLSVGGVVTSRPATSPLLHLSNLIMSSAKTTSSIATCTTSTSVSSSGGGGMFVPKVLSPGERRPTLPSGAPMGIPGHPGAGHLENRLTQLKPGQRADLGTVGGRTRPTSLGTVPPRNIGAEPSAGTVGWTSFGRKGGLL